MASESRIEWTDATWNPVTGCTPVSEGCTNCYAAAMAKRLNGTAHAGLETCHRCEGKGYDPYCYPLGKTPCGICGGKKRLPVPFSTVVCHPERLDQPLHWMRPRVVFVPSMGDLFHEGVPDAFILCCLQAMKDASRHTFLILTKRPQRMNSLLSYLAKLSQETPPEHWGNGGGWPYPNVYLGVTAENQDRWDERAGILKDIPAAHRFVSVEPMLGPVAGHGLRGYESVPDAPGMQFYAREIDCVIAGCESGPGRRPAPHDWFRRLRDQCEEMEVPFFLKQMGANEDGTGRVVKLPKLDGVVYAETPWENKEEGRG